ncbi:hypothetical protein Q1695_004712 [Nippostrongylus brasiliensis]|nr:hypothetical protein Q1695_004712 [Nippostrongylus brasiliensis]
MRLSELAFRMLLLTSMVTNFFLTVDGKQWTSTRNFASAPFLFYQPHIVMRRQTSNCGSHANCAHWRNNGFCTNIFYSESVRRQYCGRPCGMC